jgi:hypothetical protein
MNKVKTLTWATTLLAAAAAFIVLFGLGYGDLHHFDPLELVALVVGTVAAAYFTHRMVTNDIAALRLATRVDAIERIIVEHGQWHIEPTANNQ